MIFDIKIDTKINIKMRTTITKYKQGRRIYPSHYLLEATKSNGLKVRSIVKCEQIRAISKSRLKKLGTIATTDLTKVMEALKIVLNL
jgi:mRNA-degrading endonuclease toxin of MazEF toxin-antitoxin module